jgi:hypothetical protein
MLEWRVCVGFASPNAITNTTHTHTHTRHIWKQRYEWHREGCAGVEIGLFPS